MRRPRAHLVCLSMVLFAASQALGRPTVERHEFTEEDVDVDLVGDVDGTQPTIQKTLLDTIWIAEWTHDTPGPCDFSGWEKVDNHILNDGSVYWVVDTSFASWAAELGYENDLCCEDINGYGNGWYQGIRIEYDDTAPADISFDYELDSEEGFDFLRVEEDSACASFSRVDFNSAPDAPASAYRNILYSDSGFVESGSVTDVPLRPFGIGTSCVYIGFFTDGAWSPCDGLHPTNIGKALVVDNIALDEDGVLTTEDFEDASLDIGTFVNMQDSAPFGPAAHGGSWARTYRHITDNETCIENTTCALLWTDFTTPTIANDPAMAFAPGSYVVRNWLDDMIVSPWVDLPVSPNPQKTIIQFRRFPGNTFSTSRIVQGWAVRGRENVDDGMGGTLECISPWGHASRWNSLSPFRWGTPTASGNPPNSGYDMTPDFPPGSTQIQVRHRVSDWQWIAGASPPENHVPGPGPYIDNTRIGRVDFSSPVIDEGIDARYQAQDAFPTEIHPGVTPGTGEHFRPTTDRFGTTAFSMGADVTRLTPNIVTGDSIRAEIEDVRGATLVAASVYGAIVSGPHAGQAPPPYTVGANGFFEVPVSQCLASSSRPQPGCGIGCVPGPGVVTLEDWYYVDLDEEYFVGGDVLQYFWLAEDALGGVSSLPEGLAGTPSSITAAQAATNGMFEVNFLPTNNWDADYIEAVRTSNKVDPHSDPSYLDHSSQKTCILYVNRVNARRRSGDINRTSFMYTLDRLGYRGTYDVFDHTGMGNTNNHLGGRATVEQAQGYSLIVYDAGNATPSGTIMPTGDDRDAEKVDQAGWFRNWLAQASTSEAGFATLWVIGASALQERENNPLYTTEMGTSLVTPDQDLNTNPDVVAQTAFAFDVGASSRSVDFTHGARADYSVNGGCPVVRDYDGQDATLGTNVYLFADPTTGATGEAAVVMNSNAAANWNTIMMSHPWFDVRDARREAPGSLTSAEDLAKSVLEGVLPFDCIGGDPVDVGAEHQIAAPRRTMLYGNQPNPFNPMTTIRFDLASEGRVKLRIYDVAGRLVRTLSDRRLDAARQDVVWDGMDDAGSRVPSGVYFYRLEARTYQATRKMLLLE